MENTLQQVKENIEKVLVGQGQTIDLLLTAILSGGHVLVEDVPGMGKTVLARSLAKSLSADFGRVQFTPDLLPTDVTGLNFFDQQRGEFVFSPGPVFCNILLADEINRATPRTQSSLLECMAEFQVTVDGVTRRLERPFFVIATQNPVETLGTYPLPEAQLDRFLMRISMQPPTREQQVTILERFRDDEPLDALEPVCTREQIVAAGLALARAGGPGHPYFPGAAGVYCRSLRGFPQPAQRGAGDQSPRRAGAAPRLPELCPAAGPGVRHPRGYQGRGAAGAGSPAFRQRRVRLHRGPAAGGGRSAAFRGGAHGRLDEVIWAS